MHSITIRKELKAQNSEEMPESSECHKVSSWKKNNYQTKSTMYTISAPPTAIKTREMIEIK